MLLPIELGSYFFAYQPVFLVISQCFWASASIPPPSASVSGHPPVFQAIRQYSPAIRQYSPAIRQYSPAIRQYSAAIRQYSAAIRQYSPAIPIKKSPI
jgi:hypothetical protein